MKVQVPASLREGGRPGAIDLHVPATGTLRGVLDDLEGHYPRCTEKLLDGTGNIQGYVTFYVNGEDVRQGDGLNTKVAEQDEIIILPAISGGSE